MILLNVKLEIMKMITKEEFIQELKNEDYTDEELMQIVGGAISASMINTIIRGIKSFLDLGRSVGTAIRRIQSGRICSL